MTNKDIEKLRGTKEYWEWIDRFLEDMYDIFMTQRRRDNNNL